MQGDGPKKERTKLITPQVAKLEHTYKPGEVAVPTPTAGRRAVLLAGQRSSGVWMMGCRRVRPMHTALLSLTDAEAADSSAEWIF